MRLNRLIELGDGTRLLATRSWLEELEYYTLWRLADGLAPHLLTSRWSEGGILTVALRYATGVRLENSPPAQDPAELEEVEL